MFRKCWLIHLLLNVSGSYSRAYLGQGDAWQGSILGRGMNGYGPGQYFQPSPGEGDSWRGSILGQGSNGYGPRPRSVPGQFLGGLVSRHQNPYYIDAEGRTFPKEAFELSQPLTPHDMFQMPHDRNHYLAQDPYPESDPGPYPDSYPDRDPYPESDSYPDGDIYPDPDPYPESDSYPESDAYPDPEDPEPHQPVTGPPSITDYLPLVTGPPTVTGAPPLESHKSITDYLPLISDPPPEEVEGSQQDSLESPPTDPQFFTYPRPNPWRPKPIRVTYPAGHWDYFGTPPSTEWSPWSPSPIKVTYPPGYWNHHTTPPTKWRPSPIHVTYPPGYWDARTPYPTTPRGIKGAKDGSLNGIFDGVFDGIFNGVFNENGGGGTTEGPRKVLHFHHHHHHHHHHSGKPPANGLWPGINWNSSPLNIISNNNLLDSEGNPGLKTKFESVLEKRLKDNGIQNDLDKSGDIDAKSSNKKYRSDEEEDSVYKIMDTSDWGGIHADNYVDPNDNKQESDVLDTSNWADHAPDKIDTYPYANTKPGLAGDDDSYKIMDTSDWGGIHADNLELNKINKEDDVVDEEIKKIQKLNEIKNKNKKIYNIERRDYLDADSGEKRVHGIDQSGELKNRLQGLLDNRDENNFKSL